MPRNLPWISEAAASKKRTSEAQRPPVSRQDREGTPEDLVDANLNATGVVTPERRRAIRPARTPSTSPPPAPPEVEFMQEGFDADDIWMMVEDEFYATAQKFTRHIHRAEYDRLRRLARSRGDRILQALERGTDGRTKQSTELKRKLEAEKRGRKIQGEIKKAVGEESEGEDEDAYMLDAHLAGLMTGSQAVERDLTGIVKARSNTRAAAGYDRSPRKPPPVRVKDYKDEPIRVMSTFPTPADAFVSAPDSDVETEIESDDLDEANQTVHIHANIASTGRRGTSGHTAFGRGDVKISQGNPSGTSQYPRGRMTESACLSEQKHAVLSDHPAGAKRSSDSMLSSCDHEDMSIGGRRKHGEGQYLAKRRTKREQEQREQEGQNQKPRSDVISVPMWL
nr:hypothetical protein CFP56_23807 [Quercus suber]